MYLITPPIFIQRLRHLYPTTIKTLLNEFMIGRTFFKLPSRKLVASILAVTTQFLLC